jgi:hypothetical protein
MRKCHLTGGLLNGSLFPSPAVDCTSSMQFFPARNSHLLNTLACSSHTCSLEPTPRARTRWSLSSQDDVVCPGAGNQSVFQTGNPGMGNGSSFQPVLYCGLMGYERSRKISEPLAHSLREPPGVATTTIPSIGPFGSLEAASPGSLEVWSGTSS